MCSASVILPRRELQPNGNLHRLAFRLHHADEADLLRDRVRHVNLESGRRGGGGFPQTFTRLEPLQVLDEFDVRRELHLGGIVRGDRTQVAVDQRLQASAIAGFIGHLSGGGCRDSQSGQQSERRKGGQSGDGMLLHHDFPLRADNSAGSDFVRA